MKTRLDNSRAWVLETLNDGRPIFHNGRMYSEFRLPGFNEVQESEDNAEQRASRLDAAQKEVGLPLRWRQRNEDK